MTYEATRTLLRLQIPLVEIVARRGLTLNTILDHCEKLKTDPDSEIDFSYLRPPEPRFSKIRSAFLNAHSYKLSPVKSLLGDDFSYEEIRLARLFLTDTDLEND